jgi:hypothetical protein
MRVMCPETLKDGLPIYPAIGLNEAMERVWPGQLIEEEKLMVGKGFRKVDNLLAVP